MYCLKNKIKQDTAPWNIPLHLRCSILKQCIDKKHMISVLIYEYPDTSTFRYRGYNLMQITQQSSNSPWKCVYFFRHELNCLESFLNKIHLVIIIRVKWDQYLDDFIVKAKKFNIKILFDVDDLVFDLNYLPLIHNTLNADPTELSYDYWFAYISRIGFTASKSAGFLTTNVYLGEKLKDKFKKEFAIIPNFINQEQLDISFDLCNQKEKQESRFPFTIGYFSGTPSHINDFKTVYKELIALLTDYNMRLLVIGFMEFPPEMQKFIKNKKIIYNPLVDFIELQRQVAQVDVNIVPLVNNTFTNCKSELKFFEAGIVKTVTLAAPVFTFKQCINDGENGFLCKEGQWYEKISLLYKNNVLKKEIAERAFNDAINNYSGEPILKKINEAYAFFYS